VKIRLVADAVFTVDPSDAVWTPGAVEFEDGLISWVGDPKETADPSTEVRVLGGILMPGLVNTHAHSPMTLMRSAGDGLPLDRWLNESVWPREALSTDEDVFWGMTLGADEMLANGITTSCEHYEHPEAVADAVVASGLRCVYTPGIFEIPGSGPDKSWAVMLDAACRLFDEMDGRAGRLSIGFGPHAVYTVPPEGLAAVAEEAQHRDALMQIHLCETEAEGQVIMERYGMGAPALLDSVSALDGRVIGAHGIWLDDAEMDLLAERDVAIAHCPASNGKLGSGIARLTALLAKGIRVGLGTDSPASNDDLNLWEDMRLAAVLARSTAADPLALSTAAALRLATRGGAEALGLPVGALEVGRPADLIRLRTDDARFVPALDATELLGHLVWAGTGHLVTDVWVDGLPVIAAGESSTVDRDRARAQVMERARRLAGI
jgi:5-methylthioadenosine/S-adenosylhomocysteine deaminase